VPGEDRDRNGEHERDTEAAAHVGFHLRRHRGIGHHRRVVVGVMFLAMVNLRYRRAVTMPMLMVIVISHRSFCGATTSEWR
jgi:hypothetical protein